MLDGIKIELNLNDSLWRVIIFLAIIFSLFALVFNVKYINYGFITFIYGVIAQTWESAFEDIFNGKENKKDKKWILYFGHVALIAWWLHFLKM